MGSVSSHVRHRVSSSTLVCSCLVGLTKLSVRHWYGTDRSLLVRSQTVPKFRLCTMSKIATRGAQAGETDRTGIGARVPKVD